MISDIKELGLPVSPTPALPRKRERGTQARYASCNIKEKKQ